MSDAAKRLAFLVVEHLAAAQSARTLSSEESDSLEVAKQCIEEVFKVDLDADRQLLGDPEGATLESIVAEFQRRRNASKDKINPDQRQRAEALKTEGNELVSARKFEQAIARYTEAIEIDPQCAVYYSNRAAAYSQIGNLEQAVQDAETALEIDPCFCKAYSRLGQALFASKKYAAAADAYTKGLELEPTNATMRRALAQCETNIKNDDGEFTDISTGMRDMSGAGSGGSASDAAGLGGLGGLLGNPELAKMAEKLIGNNPQLLQMATQFMGNNQNRGDGSELGDLSGMLKNPDMMKMVQQAMMDPNIASKMAGMMGGSDSDKSKK